MNNMMSNGVHEPNQRTQPISSQQPSYRQEYLAFQNLPTFIASHNVA